MTLRRQDVFGVLSNRRRRYVLRYFEEEGPTTIGELATCIAAWEHDTEPEQVCSHDRKLVYNSLQQAHLPKLAELGVVEYDPREGTVRLGDNADDVYRYLRTDPDRRVPWSTIYVALAVASGLLAFAVSGDVYPVTMLSAETWIALVSGVLLLVSAGHMWLFVRAR